MLGHIASLPNPHSVRVESHFQLTEQKTKRSACETYLAILLVFLLALLKILYMCISHGLILTRKRMKGLMR